MTNKKASVCTILFAIILFSVFIASMFIKVANGEISLFNAVSPAFVMILMLNTIKKILRLAVEVTHEKVI